MSAGEDLLHALFGKPLQCPECAQGKPFNCAGVALDPETDEFVPCEGAT